MATGGAYRALTLVDVLAQLNQDSGQVIPFDPNEVVNQLAAADETLELTSETLTESTTTNYPVDVIQDGGPIAYWRLDDGVGASSVADSNPFNSTTWPDQPGTPHGTTTFGTAGAMTGSTGCTFNGSSGYIEFANNSALQLVGDLTVELWLKPASLAAAQVLISKGTAGEYALTLNTNGSVTFNMGASFSATVVPAASITAGTWYHLAVTRALQGKAIVGYLNGSQTFSGTYVSAPSTTTNVVRLGAASPTTGSFFNGVLDEVALYARVLSGSQVANHHAWGVATDVNATAYGTGRYGYIPLPVPGSPTGAEWGSGIWGTFVWS